MPHHPFFYRITPILLLSASSCIRTLSWSYCSKERQGSAAQLLLLQTLRKRAAPEFQLAIA